MNGDDNDKKLECPLLGYSEFVKMNVIPRCFYCGTYYTKDEIHCCDDFNVYKPTCNCLNKSTIRIVVDIK